MSCLRSKPDLCSRHKVEPALSLDGLGTLSSSKRRAGFLSERQSARAERGLHLLTILALSVPLLTASCGKPAHDHAHDHGTEKTAASSAHGHEHHAPHGGTPVVLGDETYHLEFVLDAGRGVLQAFVLDRHMENFIRCNAPSFEIVATVAGEKRPLVFMPVGDNATGEKAGDTALFEAQADWLKTTKQFDAVLTSLTIKGTPFANVPFNFPLGNDHD
jgi:hypothetical protein